MISIKKIIYIIIILSTFLTNGKTEIKDSLFLTVGNEAITRSDIINEIKVILKQMNDEYTRRQNPKA